MADSILDSVKQVLGVEEDYTAFDIDILMHINTAFATLNQIGIGPDAGFMIEDASATWDQFLGDDPRLNSVKTYIYLKVRLIFDPPATSFVINAIEKQIEELEWRLSVKREDESWVNPTPTPTTEPEVVIIPSSEAWYRE